MPSNSPASNAIHCWCTVVQDRDRHLENPPRPCVCVCVCVCHTWIVGRRATYCHNFPRGILIHSYTHTHTHIHTPFDTQTHKHTHTHHTFRAHFLLLYPVSLEMKGRHAHRTRAFHAVKKFFCNLRGVDNMRACHILENLCQATGSYLAEGQVETFKVIYKGISQSWAIGVSDEVKRLLSINWT